MAQYKRIPFEMVEHTELARKNYIEYERGKDVPDEAEVEAEWITKRKMLRDALDTLTPRQREILILIAVRGLTEREAAGIFGLNQSTIFRHYRAAKKKMADLMGEQYKPSV